MEKLKTKNSIRPCPICNGNASNVLHHQRFTLPDNHCLPGAYDVVACPGCGFVYADTPAQQEEYDRYYRECSKYENAGLSTGGGATPLDAQRIEQTVADIAAALPDKNAAIIDIGCANGGLLMAFKRIGYHNLTGLDPSQACVDSIEKQGIRAFTGGLFSGDPPTGTAGKTQYDCIVLSHVLEHVVSLKEAVQNTIAHLKTGGILYIEVPDASRYHDFFIVPYYYFDCEHINHFDENDLMNLVLPLGFTSVRHAKKELVVAGNKRYPAVYAMFKKKENKQDQIKPRYHETVISSVLGHIRQSSQSKAYDVFDDLSEKQQPIVIWGAGSHALRLLKNTSLGKCNIVAFVDSDQKKQGTHMDKVMVHDPEYLRSFTGTVVVCSALYYDEILNRIRQMGLSCNVISAN
jgi:SAM-dependent methyltransferase